MKRLILIVAVMLTASTPIFAQNSEQENDAAMAAVIYMVALQRCNLTTLEDGKLRGMTISEIERHGFTCEQGVRSMRRLPTMTVLPSGPSAMTRAPW